MWYMHTIGHYTLIIKEILPFAATQINLEDILLSEIYTICTIVNTR